MILPAGGHALWVAYFADRDVHEAKSRDEAAAVVLSGPIIGWVVTDLDDDPQPIPLTPDGLVNSEPYLQWTSGDEDTAVDIARDSAMSMWSNLPHNT